jgi:hypothetical protein
MMQQNILLSFHFIDFFVYKKKSMNYIRVFWRRLTGNEITLQFIVDANERRIHFDPTIIGLVPVPQPGHAPALQNVLLLSMIWNLNLHMAHLDRSLELRGYYEMRPHSNNPSVIVIEKFCIKVYDVCYQYSALQKSSEVLINPDIFQYLSIGKQNVEEDYKHWNRLYYNSVEGYLTQFSTAVILNSPELLRCTTTARVASFFRTHIFPNTVNAADLIGRIETVIHFIVTDVKRDFKPTQDTLIKVHAQRNEDMRFNFWFQLFTIVLACIALLLSGLALR